MLNFDNILSGLSTKQTIIFKIVFGLIVALVCINVFYTELYNGENWYTYQGTTGPFLMINDHISDRPLPFVQNGETVLFETSLCFRGNLIGHFTRIFSRHDDDRVVDFYSSAINNPTKNCRVYNTKVTIKNWDVGIYELYQFITLENPILGRYTKELPIITLDAR